ncbi:MAG: MFS transporter [Longimicrobiaceae bacterium]
MTGRPLDLERAEAVETASGHDYDAATRRWTLIAMVLASSVVFLDGSIVQVALPAIDRGLSAGLSGLQWVVNGNLLMVSSLLIVGGFLGDRYGRRRTMTAGLLAFGIASVASGLAQNLPWLIGARMAQGAAGALLVPAALAVVAEVFPEGEERGQAIGTWAAWAGAVGVIGPLAGGVLVDQLSWRGVFFLNLPLVLLAVWLLRRRVPETRDPDTGERLDWPGAALALAGLGGVAFGLIQGPVVGWGAPEILAALVAGVAALLGFVAWQTRAPHPLLPLGLFRSRNFSGANLTTLALYFAIGGSLFLLMIYLQNISGYPALGAGLVVLPVPGVMLLLSGRFGKWAGQVGARWFMTAGPLIAAAGLWLLSRITPQVSVWHLLGATTVLSLGLAVAVAPLTTTVMSSVATENLARASAVNNTASRLAQLLAVTVVGAVVAGVFTSRLAERTSDLALSPPAEAQLARLAADPTGRGLRSEELPAEVRRAVARTYTEAFSAAMLLAAAMAALGGVVAAATIRDEKVRKVALPEHRPSPSEHWPCLAHAQRGA